jgi:hypothetical protein
LNVKEVKAELPLFGLSDLIELDKQYVYLIRPNEHLSQEHTDGLRYALDAASIKLGIKFILMSLDFDIFKLEK